MLILISQLNLQLLTECSLTKITAAATSGEAPDITQVGSTWTAAIGAMEGALVELTGKSIQVLSLNQLCSQLISKAQTRCSVCLGLLKQELSSTEKTLAKKAGVNPETDFATWDKSKMLSRNSTV